MVVQPHKITPRVARRVIGLISGEIPSRRPKTPEQLMQKFIAPLLFPGESKAALKVHVREWQTARNAIPACTLLSEVSALARCLPSELSEVKAILLNLSNSKKPTTDLEKAIVITATGSVLSETQRNMLLDSRPDFEAILEMFGSIEFPSRRLGSLSDPIEILSILGRIFALLGKITLARKFFNEAISFAKQKSNRTSRISRWSPTSYNPRREAYRIIAEYWLDVGMLRKSTIGYYQPLYQKDLCLFESIVNGKRIDESLGENLAEEYRVKIGVFKYLADALIRQGRIKEALFLFNKARDSFRSFPIISHIITLDFPIILSIALNILKSSKFDLLAKVDKEKQAWEKGIARARLKNQGSATQEQVISDFICGGVSQPSPSRARSLLFHGTSAFAAWCSYWNSRNFVKELKASPEIVPGNFCYVNVNSLSPERLARIEKFGPIYPANDMCKYDVCLVDNLGVAYSFAHDWNILIGSKTVRMDSGNSNIKLHDTQKSPGIDSKVIQIFEDLTKKAEQQSHQAFSPGAILIVDGAKLAENDLLAPPEGEELVIAKYLPWIFIRGLLLVDRHIVRDPNGKEITKKMIVGHSFFDNNVGTELLAHLRSVASHRYRPLFTAEGLHWALNPSSA